MAGSTWGTRRAAGVPLPPASPLFSAASSDPSSRSSMSSSSSFLSFLSSVPWSRAFCASLRGEQIPHMIRMYVLLIWRFCTVARGNGACVLNSGRAEICVSLDRLQMSRLFRHARAAVLGQPTPDTHTHTCTYSLAKADRTLASCAASFVDQPRSNAIGIVCPSACWTPPRCACSSLCAHLGRTRLHFVAGPRARGLWGPFAVCPECCHCA